MKLLTQLINISGITTILLLAAAAYTGFAEADYSMHKSIASTAVIVALLHAIMVFYRKLLIYRHNKAAERKLP